MLILADFVVASRFSFHRISSTIELYFMFAPVPSGFGSTATPLMPFSPGWLVPGSMPVLVEPESDATGASPGCLSVPSFLAGAFSAPRPCFCASCFWNLALAAWPPLEDCQ